ncbi:MAG: FemAB family XrtA/PEP-CTERM system-associated protein [Desulforhopalus sp.]
MSNDIEITHATLADQDEWDSFVLSHPHASPYHLFAWGSAIALAYGHKSYFLVARQEGSLVGILPLVHLKLTFFVNEFLALPFCDVGNCLSVDGEVEKKLLEEAWSLSKQLKIRNIQLRGQLLHESNYALFHQLESNKLRMLLRLPESSESLFSAFKSKLRTQIRKAEKNQVIFRWAGKDGVDSFYAVICNNMRELGSPVHSKKLFSAIMDQYGERARIGLTEYEGKCISAGLILSTEEQTSIPWASSLRNFNHLAPNMLLYWNFLKFAADSGKKVFDFGRSTENEGTFRFKKQWGAEPFPLIWYSSYPDTLIQSASEAHGKISPRERAAILWKRLPLSVTNILGPQLRKYINL